MAHPLGGAEPLPLRCRQSALLVHRIAGHAVAGGRAGADGRREGSSADSTRGRRRFACGSDGDPDGLFWHDRFGGSGLRGSAPDRQGARGATADPEHEK
jgi:hypothetical protein